MLKIGEYTFCNSKGLTSATIGNGVTSIRYYAFYDCKGLTSVTIPKSITEIGASAFDNRTSLDDVYYPGTEAEWNAITISSGNNYLISANIHYNESGYHICNFSILSHYQAEHPHYAVYKCECGKEQVSTETSKLNACEICNPTREKPPIAKEDAEIPKVSTSTIDYGDSIVLHFNTDVALPAGAKIVWSTDNGNFSYSVSADGKTCTITPQKSGDTTFTAKVVDANGKAISEEYTQKMTSKAGFFQKLIAFFKKLFGLTKIIAQAIKYDF